MLPELPPAVSKFIQVETGLWLSLCINNAAIDILKRKAIKNLNSVLFIMTEYEKKNNFEWKIINDSTREMDIKVWLIAKLLLLRKLL